MSNPHPPFQAGGKFEVLDALRGICALLVALYHFNSNGFIAQLPFVQNGWLFVDYFFVLSGFVIAHSYGDRLRSREVSVIRFMGLRLGRIYPLHIAVLAAFILLEVLLASSESVAQIANRDAFTGTRDPGSLFQSVFLLQTFGLEHAVGWNIPAWSIAAEIWTYLAFAFVFLAGRRVMLFAAAIIASLSLLALLSYAPDLHVTFNGGILRCLFGFGLGVLTYHAFSKYGGIGGNIYEALVITASMVFVSLATDRLTFLAPFLFAGAIFVLAAQRGMISRMLAGRGFQLVGLVSYSIYMVHTFVQARIGEFLVLTGLVAIEVDARGRTLLTGDPLVGDLLTLVMLGMVIALSYLTYRLIEKPGRELSRALFGWKPRLAAPRRA